MFIINDDKYTIVICNYGHPVETMSPGRLREMMNQIHNALMKEKLIWFIEDDFDPTDRIFFVRAKPDKKQLHHNRRTSGKTEDNSEKQIFRFSKEVLGLGCSGTPSGNGTDRGKDL
jgi:hypothetical protein